jgi:hypothetical protein
MLQDTSLWHKLAVMSEEQGYIRQAIYCWNKVGPDTETASISIFSVECIAIHPG